MHHPYRSVADFEATGGHLSWYQLLLLLADRRLHATYGDVEVFAFLTAFGMICHGIRQRKQTVERWKNRNARKAKKRS
jgi:hypothetical protein